MTIEDFWRRRRNSLGAGGIRGLAAPSQQSYGNKPMIQGKALAQVWASLPAGSTPFAKVSKTLIARLALALSP
ncbi:MAG: hypothetical protein VKN60_05080 [Cyanobacteriota bacterium]|nr:hypothetical protein [Cyanobacteriota bacterium]